MYLNLSIKFSNVFGSAFDFGDVFWNMFYFGDVSGLQKSKCCLTLTFILVTCLGAHFILVTCLGLSFIFVMCQAYGLLLVASTLCFRPTSSYTSLIFAVAYEKI